MGGPHNATMKPVIDQTQNLQYHIENHQYFVGDNIGENQDFVFDLSLV